ncbi:MAG: ABC transporter permease [Desemzia incerta]|uniref:Transport permease protein n=1 Tax=Desemzia incerta TaxID=82801 RepID=A0A1I5VC08_9LACT|nr:ABC transporter permease [Desemzia incerta]SFQ05025.1 teichoic acid transport system permease protein [Desemzia incerta]
MKNVMLIIKEQFDNVGIIRRVSKYEEKATYQSHYLGLMWQFLNPLIQIGIYYLVFGLGVNGGRNVEGVPFIVWMLIGIIVWFFVNSSLLGGSNSIYNKVGMVSKMKFPVSVLPSINMASNIVSYWWMMAILIVVMFIFGVYPTIYWLQYIYYFICMIAFLFAMGILDSTITILVRDYHIMLQSILRLLFYVSGPIWDIETRSFPDWLVRIFQINPVYYFIDGFRDTFLSREWFWEKPTLALIFWGIISIILILGTHLHMKFRARFVDFI